MSLPIPEPDPPLPFPGATGDGLSVAVIDSGVNPRHPHISSQVAGGVSINGSNDIEDGSFLDLLGHGTAVMAAIQEKAPAARYFAVKLFHNSLRTSTPALLTAIEWAINKEVHVINLSLGTLNFDYETQFIDVVQRAVTSGIILVAAREASGQACLPGCLRGVLGVSLDWECPRTRYRTTEETSGTLYYASGYPRELLGMPRERNLNGISFAVANMTGFVLRARSFCSPKDVPAALVSEASTV